MVVVGTIIIVLLSVALFVFFGIYQKKSFRHKLEKQQLQIQFSHTLLQSQLEIHGNKHFNISANELHDTHRAGMHV
jgi:hypothetical protein